MTRVAIVHEWFTILAGSEKVVEQLCGLFPQADLFCIVADAATIASTGYLRDRRIQTSFIQDLPFSAKSYRHYLALMPIAIEQFDLSAYDLIISSSHAVAKGVLTGPDQLHISYVHSPIRYAWDLQHQYLRESGLHGNLKGWIAKWMLHKIRLWDYRTAAGVDHFVANSRFIARRIRKIYGRDSEVIYPPVEVDRFEIRPEKDSFYLTASRLVPYKRIDVIVEAFQAMPKKRLIVVGDGPEMNKIKAKAGPNVQVLGYQSFEVLKDLMQRARAFIFAAEEDFGITPVEAQACGTPVIAFGKGGALETIVASGPNPTGVFFDAQHPESVGEAVQRFELRVGTFDPQQCRLNSERFSTARFNEKFSAFVAAQLEAHRRAFP